MPYIRKEDQARVEDGNIQTSGELNYAITILLRDYVKTNGLSYAKINDCLGALSGATQEFYRRVAIPYEQEKIKQNGDVY